MSSLDYAKVVSALRKIVDNHGSDRKDLKLRSAPVNAFGEHVADDYGVVRSEDGTYIIVDPDWLEFPIVEVKGEWRRDPNISDPHFIARIEAKIPQIIDWFDSCETGSSTESGGDFS